MRTRITIEADILATHPDELFSTLKAYTFKLHTGFGSPTLMVAADCIDFTPLPAEPKV